MEKIYIIGASGFGKEVAWLIEENQDYQIAGFIDDDESLKDTEINGYEVLGGIEYLLNIKEDINVVIAIGKPHIREQVVDKLNSKDNIRYPNIISKDARISKHVEMGFGNIICSGNTLTVNIKLGNFNHINLNCTVGHDTTLNDYITVYPGVSISGNVHIDNYSELGTGSKVIQNIDIKKDVIIGSGGIVVRDLLESGTYVGVPVKMIS